MFNLMGVLLSGLADEAFYLDPGSGSFLLQLLIAGLAGLGIAAATQWAKIKRLFSRKNKQAEKEEPEDEPNEPQ